MGLLDGHELNCYLFVSDYFKDFSMNSTGARSWPILLLIVISVIHCSLGWQDEVILAALEASLLQIQADVITIAEAILNGSALGDGPGKVRARPEPRSRVGWDRMKNQLSHALSLFNHAVNLPDQSEEVGVQVRTKCSFLGLATSSYTSRI